MASQGSCAEGAPRPVQSHIRPTGTPKRPRGRLAAQLAQLGLARGSRMHIVRRSLHGWQVLTRDEFRVHPDSKLSITSCVHAEHVFTDRTAARGVSGPADVEPMRMTTRPRMYLCNQYLAHLRWSRTNTPVRMSSSPRKTACCARRRTRAFRNPCLHSAILDGEALRDLSSAMPGLLSSQALSVRRSLLGILVGTTLSRNRKTEAGVAAEKQ